MVTVVGFGTAHAQTATQIYANYTYSSGGMDVFSAQFEHDVTAATVQIIVQTVSGGWAGIGVGDAMVGATLFVGWSDGAGGWVASQRTATSQSLPAVVSTVTASAVPGDASTLSGASVGFAITVSDTLFSASGPTSMVFAFCATPPTTPSDPTSDFTIHDDTGSFSIDLSASSGSSATATVAAADPVTPASSASSNSTASNSSASNMYCSDSSNSYCFQAELDAAKTTVTITLQTISAGWAGVGVGCSSMVCANIYVGWLAANGSSVISQRSASGHSLPTLSATSNYNLLASNPSTASILSTSKFSVSFSIPAASISLTGSTNFIFAYSASAPSTPSSLSTSVDQHGDNAYGTFSLNIATGKTTTVSNSVNYKLIHGTLMFVAWGVIPFVSIFVARYLKARLGHVWYITHMSLGITILIATVIALVFIELSIPGSLSVRFNSSIHAYCGAFLIFGMLPAQIILGYISNHFFSPNRSRVPWWDQVHWWLGRFVVVFSWAEMFMGLQLYGSSIVIQALYFVALACGIAALVLGHFMFGGAVHHVKGAAGFEKMDIDGGGGGGGSSRRRNVYGDNDDYDTPDSFDRSKKNGSAERTLSSSKRRNNGASVGGNGSDV
ncbi:hypothetical protein HK100_003675, partial [Physocladia obscura]